MNDVSRNHYEPLRSAFGAFVAETTFMGNCNLMVEGISDQVLLAGMSSRLRLGGAPKNDYLDLNAVTLVPAGGAPHIPYLAYLARGRDIEKPAVIILLDGDKAGDEARKSVQKGGAYGKPLVPDELVLQLNQADRVDIQSDRRGGPVNLEDLIPIGLGVRAAERYAVHFVGLAAPSPALDPTAAQVDDGVLPGATAVLNATLSEPILVDKLGFARSILDEMKANSDQGQVSAADTTRLDDNFRVLFRRLNVLRRAAVRQQDEVRLAERIARVRDAFLADHPTLIRKVDLQDLIEELGYVLDDSHEAEETRADMRRLRSEYNVDVDVSSPVEDVEALRIHLMALQYGGRHRSQEEPMPTAPGASDVAAS